MKSRRLTIRLSEPDYSRLQDAARDHGLPLSEYTRRVLLAGQPPAPAVGRDPDVAATLARIETLVLAAAVSAYETQSVVRTGLTPEQTATLKKYRAGQFAAWREWGVRAAYIGLDMRPKKTKETDQETDHE